MIRYLIIFWMKLLKNCEIYHFILTFLYNTTNIFVRHLTNLKTSVSGADCEDSLWQTSISEVECEDPFCFLSWMSAKYRGKER